MFSIYLKSLFRREIPGFRAKRAGISEGYPGDNLRKYPYFAAESMELQQNTEV
jgi:hypothetical protein